MEVLFENLDKKEKSSFLKGLENINQIIKNIFEIVYINNKGVCYNNESTLKTGRCVCETNMNDFIKIEENQLFKLDTKKLYECLKAGKTKILGYKKENNNFIFLTTEGEYNIGEFINDEVLNLEHINSILNNNTCCETRNDLLEKFNNKEFIETNINDYKLFVTHKLFPSINKSTELVVNIHDNCNGTFYSSFVSKIEQKNKKDEVTFAMKIKYIYKFLMI